MRTITQENDDWFKIEFFSTSSKCRSSGYRLRDYELFRIEFKVFKKNEQALQTHVNL